MLGFFATHSTCECRYQELPSMSFEYQNHKSTGGNPAIFFVNKMKCGFDLIKKKFKLNYYEFLFGMFEVKISFW